jgi:hypothetical protein
MFLRGGALLLMLSSLMPVYHVPVPNGASSTRCSSLLWYDKT